MPIACSKLWQVDMLSVIAKYSLKGRSPLIENHWFSMWQSWTHKRSPVNSWWWKANMHSGMFLIETYQKMKLNWSIKSRTWHFQHLERCLPNWGGLWRWLSLCRLVESAQFCRDQFRKRRGTWFLSKGGMCTVSVSLPMAAADLG